MARSPLLQSLLHVVRAAARARRHGMPLREVLDGAPVPARREFLRAAGSGALLAMAGGLAGCLRNEAVAAAPVALPPLRATQPRIVIVGAGLAGLATAYHLRRSGLRAQVFEGSSRVGGRVQSQVGAVERRVVTELGGEFIDGDHADALALAREFKLLLSPVREESAGLQRMVYFAGGRRLSAQEVAEAYAPLGERIARDLASLPEELDYRCEDAWAKALDRLSVTQYLDAAGVSGWLRELLEMACRTEYGSEPSEQSALNLLTMMEGAGDEPLAEEPVRFRVVGGNERLVQELARYVAEEDLALGHRLDRVEEVRGSGVQRLTFILGDGQSRTVEADFVVLAIPFALLRGMVLQLPDLPKAKRRAIRYLSYGTNAKAILGFRERLWRGMQESGEALTGGAAQAVWESSLGQRGNAGTLTAYLGGKAGIEAAGLQDAAAVQGAFLPALEAVWPGLAGVATGRALSVAWAAEPWARGSYAVYRPGDWTSLRGAEGLPVGRVHFAGEHTSLEFTGTMNGAVESGRRAAQAVAAEVLA